MKTVVMQLKSALAIAVEILLIATNFHFSKNDFLRLKDCSEKRDRAASARGNAQKNIKIHNTFSGY